LKKQHNDSPKKPINRQEIPAIHKRGQQ